MTEQEVLIDIRERLVRVETLLLSYNSMREELNCIKGQCADNDARSKSNTYKIDEIKSNLSWLWRTIGGALIITATGAWAVFK